MSDYVDWTGQSGKSYRYWFLTNITANGINAAAGNYAFVNVSRTETSRRSTSGRQPTSKRASRTMIAGMMQGAPASLT